MSKDDTVKIKEVITEILEKYQNMDKYFRDVIAALWESNGSNNSKFLIKRYDSCHEIYNSEDEVHKTGCYIFLEQFDEKCEKKIGKDDCFLFLEKLVPVYIGVGGTGTQKDLRYRVIQELHNSEKDTGATLSKKIKEFENISADASVEKIKNFHLITIIVGERDKRCDRYKAQALEAILIALFDPEYNKQVGDKNGKNN